MKLVVLGATGPTGQEVVTEALSMGHMVTAVVRNPDRMKHKYEHLTVVKADLTDSSQLVEPFRDADAILSAVGAKLGMFSPTDVYTVIGKATIEAMREAGVKRLICVTAWGTKDDPGLPFCWRRILKPTHLRHILSNMSELEDYIVNECSDINYTIVKPSHLKNWPSCEKDLQTSFGELVKDYDSQYVSRQDVASFIIQCLNTDEFDNKLVAVTTPKKK